MFLVLLFLLHAVRETAQKAAFYLRRRFTTFLNVQVMGFSVSAGFFQILSRVIDEPNKLKTGKHMFYQLWPYLNTVLICSYMAFSQ